MDRRWAAVALVFGMLLTVSGCSSATSTPTATGFRPLLGHWYVHDGTLDLQSTMSGTERNSCGADCLETDTLDLRFVPTGDYVLATITAITYGGPSGTVPNPDFGDSQAVGDTFQLRLVAPHLLKSKILRSHLPEIDQQNGNPYYCQVGLAVRFQRLCGA